MGSEKERSDPFMEWLNSKNRKELEVFLEEVPRIFLESRSPQTIAETAKDKEKGKKWREAYVSKILDYFESKGLKKKHLAWHKNHLLKCFEKVFGQNKFFANAVEADMQWGMFVTGWFEIGIVGALGIRNGKQGYEPPPLDPYDKVRTYA